MTDHPKPPKGWHWGPWDALRANGYKPEQDRPVYCGNCDWTGRESDITVMIYDCDNLPGRLDPGSEVPVGECPAIQRGFDLCGSFVYYNDIEIAYRRKPDILEQIVEATE